MTFSSLYSTSNATMFLAACIILSSPDAHAACTLSADPMNFGQVILNIDKESTSSVSVNCDTQEAFQINATTGSGNFEARRMLGPINNTLTYNLFIDPTLTRIWGDGTGNSFRFVGLSDGVTVNRFTVYGLVPSQSGVATGSYTDQIVVTFSF